MEKKVKETRDTEKKERETLRWRNKERMEK